MNERKNDLLFSKDEELSTDAGLAFFLLSYNDLSTADIQYVITADIQYVITADIQCVIIAGIQCVIIVGIRCVITQRNKYIKRKSKIKMIKLLHSTSYLQL